MDSTQNNTESFQPCFDNNTEASVINSINSINIDSEGSNDNNIDQISNNITPEKEESEIEESEIEESDGESDDESDDESDGESDGESESEEKKSLLHFTENSDLYVVMLDNLPQFYVKSSEIAYKKMWDLARHKCLHYMCRGYNTHMNIIGNKLTISGQYYFFMTYGVTLHTLSHHRVKECL
jgi:hypothetical protein